MRTAAVILLSLVTFAGGCWTGGPERITLPASRYADAFDTTLETLRDAGYTVERVDAKRGMIATVPKPTAGATTPWDPDQATLGQEWQDLVNEQWRVVRAWFSQDPALLPPGVDGLQLGPNDTFTMGLDVTIYRSSRPGIRVETETVALQSISVDTIAASKGLLANRLSAFRLDEPLARKLLGRIERRLAKSNQR